MGDVGSLALGAGLAVISLLVNNPWSLLLVGIVFVVETASVMLQVASFKLTGKRIFKMSIRFLSNLSQKALYLIPNSRLYASSG